MTTPTIRAYRFIEQAPRSYRLGCRRAQSAQPAQNHRPQAFALRAIINRENLVRVFKGRRSRSGPGPGIDGFSFTDFSVSEFGAAAVATEAIWAGRWRPRPSRVQMARKDGGRKKRRLDIRCILDRMVSSAVADEIVARINPILASGCYGFRPGRCVHGLLAERRTAALKLEIVSAEKENPSLDALMETYCDFPIVIEKRKSGKLHELKDLIACYIAAIDVHQDENDSSSGHMDIMLFEKEVLSPRSVNGHKQTLAATPVTGGNCERLERLPE